jgi:hypothetical protein
MSRGIAAICSAQAITPGAAENAGGGYLGHHCSVLARIATSRGIQLKDSGNAYHG